MDPELWAELSMAISDVEQRWPRCARDTHPTSRIVRVHLWATLHDRPTCWACAPSHWTPRTRPAALPDQSTMSRRLRRADFDAFLVRVGRRLNGDTVASRAVAAARLHLRVVDGKPFELPNHSADPDARWGRGVSRQSLGYKLHFLCASVERPMPDAFAITPLDRCEKQMAARLIGRVNGGGGGYLLGDAHFDASWLFDRCRMHGHQLVCPRAKPGRGLGNHYQSPDRIRAIAMLESPPGADANAFGRSLYRCRTLVERRFGAAVCFGGGIGNSLPPWVRRIGRVRRWITAKLLINAARIRINQRVDT